MVHAHFRPFLHQVYDASAGGAYRVFIPGGLLPGEALASRSNKALVDFLASRGWTPNRGPSKSFPPPRPSADATANAPLAPSEGPASSACSALALAHSASDPPTSEHSEVLDSEAAPANAPAAASDSSING